MADGTSRSTVRRHHPVVARLDRERAQDAQLRFADRITAFAGSMPFVYMHVVLFGLWMILIERSPWPTLALIVSLEAIFLSTFVLMGQNRQAAFQQAKADHDFLEAEKELRINTELTRDLHDVLLEMRSHVVATDDASPGSTPAQPSQGLTSRRVETTPGSRTA
jgi:uncharacterized membrane protein